MGDDVSIRGARVGDLPRLLDLWRQLEDVQRPARHLAPAPDVEERMAASFRGAIDAGDRSLFVAEAGGTVVGMALATLDRPSKSSDEQVVDLARVVVDPAWRGRGVGKRIVEAAEEFARDRGVPFLAAKIFVGNADAVRFWERLGFETSFELRVRRVP